MEEEDIQVVFNPNAKATKTFKASGEEKTPIEQEQEKDSKPKTGVIFNPNRKANVNHDKRVEGLDLEDYKGYLGEDIYYPDEGGIQALDRRRSANQPWYEQAGSMLGQAALGEIVGGTVEGLGYLLDVNTYKMFFEEEESNLGNWLSDAGKGLREWSQDAMPIYQEDPSQSFNMSDSGWWFGNGVSVASTLSLLIPSIGATKALGLLGKGISKGAGVISKSLDVASKMGKSQKWMTKGVTQAVVSRHIENMMEASGTFEQTRNEFLNEINPETGSLFTPEEAGKLAAESAANNYRNGWAMILQDIPQYLAIGKVFNPRTMKFESALKKARTSGKQIKLKPWQQKTKSGVGTFVSEAAEESFQYYIAERANLLSQLKAGLINEEEYDNQLSEKIGDGEMKTSAFWGGLGGNIFQAVGPKTNDLFKSKSQRKYEKNYKENQLEFFKRRGDAFAKMQREISSADETGDITKREEAINEMMLLQTIEAIELDKYEQHIETLENLMSMSKEEQAAFQKEQGVDLDIELFKKYVPEIIKVSEEARSRYLKHLNKHGSQIAAAMTHNDMQVKRFNNQISRNDKEIADVRKGINGYNKMSTRKKVGAENKMKIRALKNANKLHKRVLSKTSGDIEKKHLEDIIKNNNEEIKILESETKDLNQVELSNKEKLNDKKHSEDLEQGLDEIYDYALENVMLENASQMRVKNNKVMGTKEFQRERKIASQKRRIDKIDSTEDIDKSKENLEQNEDYSAKEKEEFNKLLDQRRKVVAAEEKKAKEKEQKEKHIQSAKKKAAEKAQKDKSKVPNTNQAPMEDGIEDPYADEEPDINETFSNKQDNHVDLKVAASKSVALLDAVPGTEAFQEWKQNGKSKIGTKVTYEIATDYSGNDRNILEALEIYQTVPMEEWTVQMRGQIRDYLPIRARINESVFTFLPTLTANNEFFDANYAGQRNIIIERLASGQEAETEVQYTSGGQVIEDYNEETNTVPEHSVLDLKQIDSIDDVEFLVTNLDGLMVDTSKELHPDYIGTRMVLGSLDTNGNPMPYRGGLFLNVRKADGTKFPLRLNFLKNTQEQAEVLTDLLLGLTLTKKGGQAAIPMKSALSTFEPSLRERIESVMGPELEVIGKDPKAEDILNMFLYVSELTDGLQSELYMKKGKLYFGGKVINYNDRSNKVKKKELTEFLRDTKRRQFSLRLYNEFPKYKKFVAENKIVNTNATITGSLFQTTPERRIQTYVKPLYPGPKPIVDNTQDVKLPKSVQIRVDKSMKIGYHTDDFDGSKGFLYIYPGSKRQLFVRGTKEEAKAKVMKKYNDEVAKMKIPNENRPVKPVEDNNEPVKASPKKVVSSPKVKQKKANAKQKKVSVKRNPRRIVGTGSAHNETTKSIFDKEPKVLKNADKGKTNTKCE